VPTRRPEPAPEDWPETETMVRAAEPFAPLRRARLDPDDAPALVVPALVADSPRDPASLAGLH
jgi:hypothetical protein